MFTRAFFLSVLILLINISNSLSKSSSDENLLRIVITPTRFETKINQTASNIIILDKKDIENSNSSSLSELLNSQVGIISNNQGGVGQTSSYFIQGFEKKYISILIDGISFADNTATQSETYLNTISLDEIERIEILKGPQGAIYGSSAAGGVISIITKSNNKKGINNSFSSKFGSFGTVSSAINTGYSSDKWNFNLSINGAHSDGFSAKSTVEENENDSFNSAKTALKFSIKNENNLNIFSTFRQIDNKLQYDNAYTANDFNKIRQTAGSFKIEKKNNFLNSFIQIAKQRTVRQFGTYQYYGDTLNFDFLNQYDLNYNHELIFGFEYDDEKYDDKTTRADTDRHSFLTGLNGNINSDIGYDISIREENDTKYGSQISSRVESFYQFAPYLNVAFSNSSGFRNPSLYEAFGPYGLSTISPETTKTNRLTFSGKSKKINGAYSVNAFKSKISNLIAYEGSGYKNVTGTTNISGMEGSIKSKLKNDLFYDIGITTTHKKTSDDKKNILLPRYTFSNSINYIFNNKMSFNFNSFYSEGAHDTSNVELPSYILFGLKANYKLNSNTKFNLSVVNIFDEDYVVNRDYNTSGRALYLGFKSEF